MKKFKMTLLTSMVAASVLALAGCGGGASDGPDNSAQTLVLTPSAGSSTLIAPNGSIKATMISDVRRTSSTDKTTISSMLWTITGNNGETATPILSDPTCAGLNVTGVIGECDTTISVPQSVTSGVWTVTGTAKASNNNQRSASFTVNVDNAVYNLSAGNAQSVTTTATTPFSPVLLTGTLTGNNGGKVYQAQWVELSGPAVDISNATTLNASFNPVQGVYKFQLTVIVDGQTIVQTTDVTATVTQ